MKELIITIITILIVGFLVFSTGMEAQKETCKEKYGESWTVYQDNSGGIFCKNIINGDIKSK